MTDAPTRADVEATLERTYRAESGRILATLIGLLGDFDLAEEALQEAFAAALVRWPAEGVPEQPRAWLVGTGRHKGIDRLRRERRGAEKVAELYADGGGEERPGPDELIDLDSAIPDDRLRLIFTCCHPALAPEAQVALTLRTVCGLTTDQIARAFLAPVPTIAQRLVRAKTKIRDARIPYAVPRLEQLPERVEAVLACVYLVFNEGYAATSGDALVRRELCGEAIRLNRVLNELLPNRAEVLGLLALMLLHDSRRDARETPGGDLVLLDEQDRRRWNREAIDEGLALVESALAMGPAGPYAIQAAIAAVHASAPTSEATDWRQIAGLYQVLLRARPSPVIELNYAVAVAMVEGPERGLELVEDIERRGALEGYHLLPAVRGELLRRLRRHGAAAAAYRAALDQVRLEPERRFLQRRLEEVTSAERSRGDSSGRPQ